MRVSVITFPGSNCDQDAIHAWSKVLGAQVTHVWHKDTDLANPELVFLAGGFSFGDYLRAGAIACFSPIMAAVQHHYKRGGYVMGVCNGFQMLCEMGILPGALLTNRNLRFLCQDTYLRVENTNSAFTADLKQGDVLCIPIAHGMGQYYADEDTLDRLEQDGQVAFRYTDPAGNPDDHWNPNGSRRAIAGITSASGRALGMMPHPERHVEAELGSADGVKLFRSMMHHLVAAS